MAEGCNPNEGEVIFRLAVETDKTHNYSLFMLLAVYYLYCF